MTISQNRTSLPCLRNSVLDLDELVHYVDLLGNSTIAAKLGFFLEQHRAALMREETRPVLEEKGAQATL